MGGNANHVLHVLGAHPPSSPSSTHVAPLWVPPTSCCINSGPLRMRLQNPKNLGFPGVFVHPYGGFLKWWYLTIVGFFLLEMMKFWGGVFGGTTILRTHQDGGLVYQGGFLTPETHLFLGVKFRPLYNNRLGAHFVFFGASCGIHVKMVDLPWENLYISFQLWFLRGRCYNQPRTHTGNPHKVFEKTMRAHELRNRSWRCWYSNESSLAVHST